MKQLSSSEVFIFKKIIPPIWIGGLLLLWIFSATTVFSKEKFQSENILFLVIPPLILCGGLVFIKGLYWDSPDHVAYDDSSILIRWKGKNLQIPFLKIANIEYHHFNRMPRLEIMLYCADPDFGKVILVHVPYSCGFKHPDIVEFLEVFQKNRYRTSKDRENHVV